jgi:tetratricopeptide (TPR) repeat protein
MNCFYHPQVYATAQCKYCGKGVCPDCTYDAAGDIYCYDDAKSSAEHDLAIARSENTAALALTVVFTIMAALGVIFQMVNDPALGVFFWTVPLAGIGIWSLYWGWKRWRRSGRGFGGGFILTGGGGPIAAAVRIALVLLFIEIVLAIMMLIGLFTGLPRFLQNRKIIAMMNDDWASTMFPGKYVPDMGYTPDVPPDDPDGLAAYDRDLAHPSNGANTPSRDELPRRWQEVVEALEAINALQPSDDVKDRLGEARRKLRITELQNVVRVHAANRNWKAVLAADNELTQLDPEAGDPDSLASKARAELLDAELAASYAQGVKQLKEHDWTDADEATFRVLLQRRASYRAAADYHTALRLFDAGRWEEAVEALGRVTRLDSAYQDAPALLDRARREQDAAALAEQQARRQAEEQDRREGEAEPFKQDPHDPTDKAAPTQKNISARLPREPLKIITVVDEAEASKQVQRPQRESRNYRAIGWVFLAALLASLLVAAIIALANNGDQSNTAPTPAPDYDKLLSHLPASETCNRGTIAWPEVLAEASCSSASTPTHSYRLWKNDASARSSVRSSDMSQGDCLSTPPYEANAYQYWSSNGMAGLLTCHYYDGHYFVDWSVDQLAISASFQGDHYHELVGIALKARDEVK